MNLTTFPPDFPWYDHGSDRFIRMGRYSLDDIAECTRLNHNDRAEYDEWNAHVPTNAIEALRKCESNYPPSMSWRPAGIQ